LTRSKGLTKRMLETERRAMG